MHAKSRKLMELKNEPNNWMGLGLILVLIALFAVAIRWFGVQ